MSPFSVCLTFSSWVFPSSPHRSASSYLASLISLIFLLLFHFTLLARFLPRVARFVGNTGINIVFIQSLSELADQNNAVKSLSSGNNRKNIFKNPSSF
jgi:hypothetical protein